MEEKDLKFVFDFLRNKQFADYEYFCPKADDGTSLGFKPAMVAWYIADHEDLKFKTDVDTGILYFYNGKSWVPDAEPYLEYICQKILDQENRQSHYKNILHSLKAFTYNELEFSKKIACENGLLDVETQTLTDFNYKEMPFHYIPVKYDAEAKCPNWEVFISQVVNPDDLATIQEWSGYLLLADYRFHKLLWVHGEGRNGKGVWQRTMEAVLGSKNVSNIGLEEFDGNHRFTMRQLYGKLANFCSEPKTNKALETTQLKFATGKDTIEAEIKGKQNRLSFRNTAKITVMGNKFPKVNDNTIPFRERRLCIKFPN
jgi:putative DNA primase/helicase